MQNLIGARHGPLRIWTLEQPHGHVSLNDARLEDTEVPARASVSDDQRRQLVHPPSSRELPAWLARLAHFKPTRSDADDVADVDGVFTYAGNGEILAEAAVRHLGHVQLAPPFPI